MIVVVDSHGKRHELTDRLERLVALIVENSGEIAQSENAQLVFHCAGKEKVKATIEKTLVELPRPNG